MFYENDILGKIIDDGNVVIGRDDAPETHEYLVEVVWDNDKSKKERTALFKIVKFHGTKEQNNGGMFADVVSF